MLGNNYYVLIKVGLNEELGNFDDYWILIKMIMIVDFKFKKLVILTILEI